MGLPSLLILPLPATDPGAAEAALSEAHALAAGLPGARVLAPAADLCHLVPGPLASAVGELVVFVDPAAPLTPAEILRYGERLQATGAIRSGPVFPVGRLRSALRAPLVAPDRAFAGIGLSWLIVNATAWQPPAGASARPELPPVRTPRQALALLALAHEVLCRSPLLPETAPLRTATTLQALGAWSQHRPSLPRQAERALGPLLGRAPDLPAALRVRLLGQRLAARLRPVRDEDNLSAFCLEIEVSCPGLFGGPSLTGPLLQP